MRRRRLYSTSMMALLLVLSSSPGAAVESQDQPAWSDEFDGAAGAGIDRGVWTIETGDNPDNRELQFYTDESENLALDGSGNLAIVARVNSDPSRDCWHGGPCEWTSARMTTKGTVAFRYGWAEARIKVPKGAGLWPAFWMLGEGPEPWPFNGEIDVMEWIGGEPNRVYGSAHFDGSLDTGGMTESLTLDEPFSDDFHVFAIDKQPGSIVWYVDGREYYRITRTMLPVEAEWVFDRPFYILLNLAVGGDWPGPPDESTTFPAVMLVDYVRLYGDVVVADDVG